MSLSILCGREAPCTLDPVLYQNKVYLQTQFLSCVLAVISLVPSTQFIHTPCCRNAELTTYPLLTNIVCTGMVRVVAAAAALREDARLGLCDWWKGAWRRGVWREGVARGSSGDPAEVGLTIRSDSVYAVDVVFLSLVTNTRMRFPGNRFLPPGSVEWGVQLQTAMI